MRSGTDEMRTGIVSANIKFARLCLGADIMKRAGLCNNTEMHISYVNKKSS